LHRKLLQLVAIASLFAAAAHADDLVDLQRSCIERGNFHKGVHWLEECVQELFTMSPVHVTMTSIAPGAGIGAFGPGLAKTQRIYHWDFVLTGTAAVSDDGSYVTAAQITFGLPPATFWRTHPDCLSSAREKYGVYQVQRPPGEDPLDSKTSVTLGYRRFDAREQDFYGLGPNSVLAGHAGYGLLLNETYLRIDNPLSVWSSVGFNLSFLQPRVTSTVNTSIPQLRDAYNSTDTPGLNSREDYMRYEPYVQFRFPAKRSLFTTLRAGYAFYENLGTSAFSFQRLSVASSTFIPLRVPSRGTSDHRHWIQNAVCPSMRSAKRCSLGDLKLVGVVALAYKGAASQVPFYFDQTLGGADISGNDTLRGFNDYRFRAPSSLLFQAEYRHKIWGPLGLLAFYDLGKVALLPSDLSLDHLRHDIGLGAYLRIGNREVIRAYVGFGTGEPYRIKPKIPVSF